MRVVCVWKEASEAAREVREWVREFETRTGVEVELLDPETREGETFCRAHDVTMYPTLLVMGSDGRVAQEWRGTPMPMMDAVTAYLV